MGEPPITRRSLLLAGVGALAGTTLGPAAALAAAAARRERTGSIELPTVGPAARTVELPRDVAIVGLQGSALAGASPTLRVRLAGGSWGPWTAAHGGAHGPEAPTSSIAAGGEPLWVGGARELQLRSDERLSGVRLRFVTSEGDVLGAPAPSARQADLALARPVLAAGPGQPSIIARSTWSAGTQLPRVAPEYGAVKLAFVHHTENPNGYTAAQVPAMLRAIYAFHRDVNGWNDIGYNFVVDLFGRVFEARAGGIDEPVVGAHAGGYNLVSTGVAVLGSFSGTPLSAPARQTLQRLIAWKLALHGTPSRGRVVVRVNPAGAVFSKYPARAHVSLPRIAGHRDADSTECPGDALYGELPGVRRAVASLAGTPLVAKLDLQAAPPAAPEAGTTPASGAPTATPAPSAGSAVPSLLTTLTLLDGAPVAGAPVILQARTVSRRGELINETTLAEGVSDAEGRCLLAASFAAGAARPLWVRALHPGGAAGGAAVSRAVRVDPVAAVSPTASVPSG